MGPGSLGGEVLKEGTIASLIVRANLCCFCSLFLQFLSDGYVAHLAQLEAASLAHSPKGTTRPTLGKGSYGCPAPVDFLRKQSQLLRSRGQSQVEREGSGSAQPRGKARSVSLKLDSEE